MITRKAFMLGASALLLASSFAAQAEEIAAIRLIKGVSATSSCSNPQQSYPVNEGETVYYCYTVENIGNVTFNYHTLTDDKLGTLLGNDNQPLAPGATRTVHQAYTVTVTDSLTIDNQATWVASQDSQTGGTPGLTAQAEARADITVRAASISLSKTVSSNLGVCDGTGTLYGVAIGSEVTYCYTVHNTGGRILTNHDLTDSELGDLLNDYVDSVLPGDYKQVLSTPVTITADITNTATWTASNPNGNVPVSDTTANASATATVAPATLSLSKTVSTTNTCGATNNINVVPGSDVYYCYTATNTSPFNTYVLDTHTLSDDQLGTLFSNRSVSLAPGASDSFIAGPVTIGQTTHNTGTWSATGTVTDTAVAISASDNASATVTAVAPSISLVKTVSTSNTCGNSSYIDVPYGSSVFYCYTVTNTSQGAAAIFDSHDLYDDQLGQILTNYQHVLAPGASTSHLYGPVAIHQSVVNSATWTASGTVGGTAISASDANTASVDLVYPPILPEPAPAASNYAIAGLAMLMALLGGLRIRRRRR